MRSSGLVQKSAVQKDRYRGKSVRFRGGTMPHFIRARQLWEQVPPRPRLTDDDDSDIIHQPLLLDG